MKSPIVYLVAMEVEIKGIFELSEFSQTNVYGFTIYSHKDNQENPTTIIIQTGIGKSNAAAAAQLALQLYPQAIFINVGVVGAFNHSLLPGQVVHVTRCAFFDVDVTALGFAPGQIPGTSVTTYELPQLETNKTLSLAQVSLVTGDTFLNDATKRASVIEQFHPDIVDMELASIAHVFYLHQKSTQLRALKAITDYADNNSPSEYKKRLPEALHQLKNICN